MEIAPFAFNSAAPSLVNPLAELSEPPALIHYVRSTPWEVGTIHAVLLYISRYICIQVTTKYKASTYLYTNLLILAKKSPNAHVP